MSELVIPIESLPLAVPSQPGQVAGLQGGIPHRFDTAAWLANRLPVVRRVSGASYTVQLADEGAMIILIHTAACTLVLPTHGAIPIAVNTVIPIVQGGAGRITVTGTGVTIRKSRSNGDKTRALYSVIFAAKIGPQEWIIYGDTQST